MKVLAVDHFFRQDLEALQRAAPQHEIRAIPYRWLRDLALHVFKPENFTGFDSYADAAFADAEKAWDRQLEPILDRIWAKYPYDVLILPSDIIFYLRALVRWCQHRGIPTVVVQKETSISKATMEEHSVTVRDRLPFMSDAMTVNSERQREFWIRAGADPTRITVTGQPRFDIYADRVPRPRRPRRPRVLFFSYHTKAYIPATSSLSSWQSLHRDTMSALVEVGKESADVTVKPHPQQDLISIAELRSIERNLARTGGSFRVAHGDEDTRMLIRGADLVIGFQSTALFEAVIAGREVIYTGWSVPDELQSQLLSFDDLKQRIHMPDGPEQLRILLEQLVSRQANRPPEITQVELQAVESQLGRIDGHCSERVWAVIESVVTDSLHLAEDHKPVSVSRRANSRRARLAFRGLSLADIAQPRRLWRRTTSQLRLTGEIPSVERQFPAMP